MRNTLTASVGIAILLVGAAALLSHTEARRGGGADVGGGRHVAYRAPAGTVVRAGGGGHSLTACAYQYGGWQATGSTYWRDLYYQCTKASDAADEGFD